MEEILPAARLLSRATAVAPLDYERAKAAFLTHMQRAGVAAAELGTQVRIRAVTRVAPCAWAARVPGRSALLPVACSTLVSVAHDSGSSAD